MQPLLLDSQGDFFLLKKLINKGGYLEILLQMWGVGYVRFRNLWNQILGGSESWMGILIISPKENKCIGNSQMNTKRVKRSNDYFSIDQFGDLLLLWRSRDKSYYYFLTFGWIHHEDGVLHSTANGMSNNWISSLTIPIVYQSTYEEISSKSWNGLSIDWCLKHGEHITNPPREVAQAKVPTPTEVQIPAQDPTKIAHVILFFGDTRYFKWIQCTFQWKHNGKFHWNVDNAIYFTVWWIKDYSLLWCFAL